MEQVPVKAVEARKVVPRAVVGHHPSALARSARGALAMMARERPAARAKMLAPLHQSSCPAPRRGALSIAHHCPTASITPAFSASPSTSSSISTSRIRLAHTRPTGTAATPLNSCPTCHLRCRCHQILEAVARSANMLQLLRPGLVPATVDAAASQRPPTTSFRLCRGQSRPTLISCPCTPPLISIISTTSHSSFPLLSLWVYPAQMACTVAAAAAAACPSHHAPRPLPCHLTTTNTVRRTLTHPTSSQCYPPEPTTASPTPTPPGPLHHPEPPSPAQAQTTAQRRAAQRAIHRSWRQA